MVNALIKWFLSALAVMVAAYILPGIQVSGFFVALVLVIVFAILNTFVKPLILLLTLPVNLLTLGLFTFVINGLIVLLASWLVKGFVVTNIWWGILFSLVLMLVNSILYKFIRD
jgi:putative membrane protein